MTIMVNSYMSRRIYTSIKWIPSSQEVLLSFKKFALPAIFTKERHLLASMLLRVLVDFISGSVCCSKLYEFFYCYMNDVFLETCFMLSNEELPLKNQYHFLGSCLRSSWLMNI